jgi:hypothetical protein
MADKPPKATKSRGKRNMLFGNKKDKEPVDLRELDLQYLAAAAILGGEDGKVPTAVSIKVAVNKARMLYEAVYLSE